MKAKQKILSNKGNEYKKINVSEKSLNVSCWYNKQLKKMKNERIIEFYYIDFL